MRTSQKVVAAVAGGLAGGIVLTTIAARIALTQVGDASSAALAPSPDSERISRSYDLDGFTGLDIEGSWQVSIAKGDDWQVQLDYPAGAAGEVDVSLRRDILRLERNTSRAWRWWGQDRGSIRATVVMPDLERIHTAGASALSMSGFDGDRLEIHTAGAVQVDGRDGRYDEVEISAAGASDIDLSGIAATDAHVELAGASNVALMMDGGVLSGSMAGAGRLEYYGTVAEQRVDVSGFGRVRRAD